MGFESFPQSTLSQEKQESVGKGLETGKKVFRFLKRTKLLDLRKSDEQFNNWFHELSYEGFSDYLTRLNGILRKVPIKQRSVDGKNVEISFGATDDISYLPPAAEQKNDLMKETFDVLKEIPDNEDRALLIYYALQAIHPYSDGNGRTGRLLYEIIGKDGKELTKEQLSDLLDHDQEGHTGTGKGRDIFAEKVLDASSAYYFINREVAKEILGENFLEENGKIYATSALGVGFLSEAAKKKLSPEEATLTEKILGEGDVQNFSFRNIVLAKFLQERPDLQKYQYKVKRSLDNGDGVVSEDIGKKIVGIDSEELMPLLTENDARRLIEIHGEVKTKFIESMIDIFANPENHQIKNKDGKEVPIKNVFRRPTITALQ